MTITFDPAVTDKQSQLPPATAPMTQPSENRKHPKSPGSSFRLELQQCADCPTACRDAQAVEVRGKVYVGGGILDSPWTTGDQKIHVYDIVTNSWTNILSPAKYAALALYGDQLVLAGGQEIATGHPTRQLWVLTEAEWQQTIPPMRVPRFAASAIGHGKHLVVAGGWDGDKVFNTVEVYDGHKWDRTESLPVGHFRLKSTVVNDMWYLMGGWISFTAASDFVLCAKIQTLVEKCSSSVSDGQSAWISLSRKVKCHSSAVSSLRGNLISLGGKSTRSDSYSHYIFRLASSSWVKLARLPEAMSCTCAVRLSSGAVMVMCGEVLDGGSGSVCTSHVYRIALAS